MDFFPGPSIVIHLGVILFSKISEKLNLGHSFRFLRKLRISYFLSYFIIFFISSLIFINAFLLIKISLKDNNFQMAKNLISVPYASAVSVYHNLTFDSKAPATLNSNSTVVVAEATAGVSTGLTNNIFLDYFFLPLVITVLIVLVFKSHILKFGQWIDERKSKYYKYKAHKNLQFKIAKIKAKDFFLSG
jgi:hypothetical protein